MLKSIYRRYILDNHIQYIGFLYLYILYIASIMCLMPLFFPFVFIGPFVLELYSPLAYLVFGVVFLNLTHCTSQIVVRVFLYQIN
jgi:hypothetical protein